MARSWQGGGCSASSESPTEIGRRELTLPRPGCNAIADTFCQPDRDDPGPCEDSIREMLEEIRDDPENAGFTDLVETGATTHNGHRLVGLRIGRTTGTQVPQLVVFAGLHANEWASTGVALEAIRDLVEAFKTEGSAFQRLRNALGRRAILIVPSANPDGYAYTFTAFADARDWRKNREPCTEEPAVGACGPDVTCGPQAECILGACYPIAGVDLYRNFPYNWRDSEDPCASPTYEGRGAASEREICLLDDIVLGQRLIVDGDTASPHTFRTELILEYGAPGNAILFPDGVSDGADGELHAPCRSLDGPENCQPPELALLRHLAGTEDNPRLVDERTGEPYKTDTVYRTFEAVGGDPLSHYAYGNAIPEDQQAVGLSVRVTATELGLYAECMDPDQWKDLTDLQSDFLRGLLVDLPSAASVEGARKVPSLGKRTGRRVHRLRSDDDSPPDLYGPPRFWIDQDVTIPGAEITPPEDFDPGTTAPWDTAGLFWVSYSSSGRAKRRRRVGTIRGPEPPAGGIRPPLARGNAAPERAGRVKGGSAGERSERTLDAPEHSGTMALRGAIPPRGQGALRAAFSRAEAG